MLDLPRISKLSLEGFVNRGTSEPLDLQHLKELENLRLHCCTIANMLLPAQLKHLDIKACKFVHLEPRLAGDPLSPNVYPPLDNLETLQILASHHTGVLPCGAIPPAWPAFMRLAAWKSKPGKLTSLAVSQNASLPNGLMPTDKIPWSLSVKSLVVNGPITDEDSLAVRTSCPDLETLYISDAAITGVFVSDLIEAQGSKLRTVTAKNCTKMSRDIVPWAKERGVVVNYISPQESVGARRVRELD